MSREVELEVVDSGEDDHRDVVWGIKERIRREDGSLKQNRSYFEREYRRHRVYLLRETTDRKRIVAFAIVHPSGYLSLLGVSPSERRRGLGTRLLERIAEDYRSIRCHTRAANQGVREFYASAGFSLERKIVNYYKDGADALELRWET